MFRDANTSTIIVLGVTGEIVSEHAGPPTHHDDCWMNPHSMWSYIHEYNAISRQDQRYTKPRPPYLRWIASTGQS